ncbi:MAG: hypothetical protein RLZZ446_1083 [Bacteroidota bacterium]|jgi:2-dehydro-3-deoxygluconokinase
MKKSVVAYGELLLRLTTPSIQRFEQSESFSIHFGGAEANVLASLSQWGMSTSFVSTLPNHSIGEAGLSQLKKFSIGTAHVKRTVGRQGLYFLEQGSIPRAAQVIYDRSNSAFVTDTDKRDWESILASSSWLHSSTITPVLTPHLAAELVEAFTIARRLGIGTSLDLNYRAQLCSRSYAQPILKQLLPLVDVFIGMDTDMESLLGISYTGSPAAAPRYYLQKIQETYGCKLTATTLRDSTNPPVLQWSAIAYDGSQFYASAPYTIEVIDRIGTGDAFTAGLLYAFLEKQPLQQALDFATAAGAWKHSIPGDFNNVSLQELSSLLQGDRGGAIRR